MRDVALTGLVIVLLLGASTAVAAQEAPLATRAQVIERQQAAKVGSLHPYQPDAGERWAQRAEDMLVGGLRWHPFFESAYSGGGFTLGAGYMRHVSSYNTLDVRGSYTVSGYKRVEAEFLAPRLFKRRATLSILGGWREATRVNFYGIGGETSEEDRMAYQFDQPRLSGLFTIRPTRQMLMFRGGVEWSQWSQGPAEGGSAPSVETRFTPETLPGLGASVPYLHTQATVGVDSRVSPGYARRGGFYGVTGHDYYDRDRRFGFQQVDYEALQHIPILREAWVISLRGLVSTAFTKDDQEIPFFMLPSLGGGSNLRGYSSWRYRDRHSLLLQAEWRVMVNRYFDTAFFYDTGKVAARTSDLNFEGHRHDFGVGVRFHGPTANVFRFDVAKGREGLHLVFAMSPVF